MAWNVAYRVSWGWNFLQTPCRQHNDAGLAPMKSWPRPRALDAIPVGVRHRKHTWATTQWGVAAVRASGQASDSRRQQAAIDRRLGRSARRWRGPCCPGGGARVQGAREGSPVSSLASPVDHASTGGPRRLPSLPPCSLTPSEQTTDASTRRRVRGTASAPSRREDSRGFKTDETSGDLKDTCQNNRLELLV
jgi:hypothetical protein